MPLPGSWDTNTDEKTTIAIEEVPCCLFCGNHGEAMYANLSDRLFGAPGEWSFSKCPGCKLVWLNPRPVEAEIGQVYRAYFTHDPHAQRPRGAFSPVRRFAQQALLNYLCYGPHDSDSSKAGRAMGFMLSRIGVLRERGLLATMCLTATQYGRLLDVGCGSGHFLSRMRAIGWSVTGVETDATAARLATQQHDVSVFTGTLMAAKFENCSFDAITLSHVIEHVHDPVGLLAECRRLLEPDGKLVLVTPNAESLGHVVFGNVWRGLEPPRHLHLFSEATLRMCCERAGLSARTLRTSARSARGMWNQSEGVRRQLMGVPPAVEPIRSSSLLFSIKEALAVRSGEPRGEELLLIASKNP